MSPKNKQGTVNSRFLRKISDTRVTTINILILGLLEFPITHKSQKLNKFCVGKVFKAVGEIACHKGGLKPPTINYY